MFKKKNEPAIVDPNRPLMVANGRGGSIELFQHKIVIKRKGAISAVTHGKKGEKEIWLHSISAIQLKKPGLATAGLCSFP